MRKALLMFALIGLASTTWAAQFSRQTHYTDYVKDGCMSCHSRNDPTIRPPIEACKKCHDDKFLANVTFPGTKTHGVLWALDHKAEAIANPKECEICHTEGNRVGAIGCTECHQAGKADEMGKLSNNMVNVHRGDFKVSHPLAARANPKLCQTCHESQKFCTKCHEDFAPEDLSILSHRKGWSSLSVGGSSTHADMAPNSCQTCHPNSVLPAHEWSSNHAREARRNLATCQACHPDGDVCLRCHSARSGLGINPHPEGWGGMKNRLKRASDGKTCRKCH
jgi:hypothetical protein